MNRSRLASTELSSRHLQKGNGWISLLGLGLAAVVLLPLYATVTDRPKPYSGASQSSQRQESNSTAAPLNSDAHDQGIVDVSSDVLKVTFDSAGGSLVRAELLRYADNADNAKPMVLFDNSDARIFLGQSGIIGGKTAGSFPTHRTPMRRIGTLPPATVGGQQVITFVSNEVGGLVLTKTYVLEPGSYSLAVRHEIRNVSADPISPQLYMQFVRDGNSRKLGLSERLVFIGPAVYTGSKGYQRQEFFDIKKKKADFEKHSNDGYIAMVEHN